MKYNSKISMACIPRATADALLQYGAITCPVVLIYVGSMGMGTVAPCHTHPSDVLSMMSSKYSSSHKHHT